MRQMVIFGQSGGKIVEEYSREFEKTFLQHFRTAHKNSRIAANVIYNEFIADRNHVHMNSTKVGPYDVASRPQFSTKLTHSLSLSLCLCLSLCVVRLVCVCVCHERQWVSLTAFVMHLGKTGKCKVEETPKGFFMTLLEKDPNERLRDGIKEKKKKAEEAEEVRHAKALSRQVSRAQRESGFVAEEGGGGSAGGTEIDRGAMAGPLGFDLKSRSLSAPSPSSASQAGSGNVLLSAEGDGGPGGRNDGGKIRKKSALDEIMEEQEAAKRRRTVKVAPSAPPRWARSGIIVKIMAKALKSEGFYKEKAEVAGVETDEGGRHVAQLRHLKTGAVLKVDQAQLETVIPKEGGRVVVLRGKHEGSGGTLVGVSAKRYQAEVEMGGPGGARSWFEYDDISKAAK